MVLSFLPGVINMTPFEDFCFCELVLVVTKDFSYLEFVLSMAICC
jgi:hypothetical protein